MRQLHTVIQIHIEPQLADAARLNRQKILIPGKAFELFR